MEAKKTIFGRRTVAIALIVLGWIMCAYLFFRYTQLKNVTANSIDFCQAIFGISCDSTLTSSISWQLGVPLLGWGMAYFGLLALLFSFRNRVADRFVLLLAAFGVGVSAILTVLIIRNNLVCPLCLVIHFINLVALIAVFLSTGAYFSYNELKPSRAKFSYLKWGLVVLIAVTAGGFTEVRIIKTFIPDIPKVNEAEIVKKFQGEQVYDIPKSPASPYLGAAEAPVQLVVFSSFQCPSCKSFASVIDNIQKDFGKNVCITFKNFPLSTNCNPRLGENMQPQSCDAAFAALAAHRQNRFWPYHDGLFQSNLSADNETLTSIAKNSGLDMAKWEEDRHSDVLKKQLMEDLKIAYKLRINATPTVFINGRKLSSVSEQILQVLIRYELSKTASR